jgi:predicted membrane channel-forming protein YqfA (hemolysin III family)
VSEDRTQHVHSHTVRPRWTWIALVVMLAGLVLIAAGIIAQSWRWAIPGVVLLVMGGVAALYGGFFYDVQGGASSQLHDVVEGNEHRFPGAGTKRSEPELKREVRERWLSDEE